LQGPAPGGVKVDDYEGAVRGGEVGGVFFVEAGEGGLGGEGGGEK